MFLANIASPRCSRLCGCDKREGSMTMTRGTGRVECRVCRQDAFCPYKQNDLAYDETTSARGTRVRDDDDDKQLSCMHRRQWLLSWLGGAGAAADWCRHQMMTVVRLRRLKNLSKFV